MQYVKREMYQFRTCDAFEIQLQSVRFRNRGEVCDTTQFCSWPNLPPEVQLVVHGLAYNQASLSALIQTHF